MLLGNHGGSAAIHANDGLVLWLPLALSTSPLPHPCEAHTIAICGSQYKVLWCRWLPQALNAIQNLDSTSYLLSGKSQDKTKVDLSEFDLVYLLFKELFHNTISREYVVQD